MPSDPTTSANEIYARTRDDFIEQIRGLAPEQAATAVPLCPGWTVKDVVAHVCGIVADVLEGRLEGLGTDEWTARQVDTRAEMTAVEVCDEWASYGPGLDELLTANPAVGPRLIGDLIVHVHDAHAALELPVDTDSEATVVGAHRYVPDVQERVAERLGIALTVELSDGSTWPPPNPEATQQLSLRTTPYDFLRSVTARRNRAEVEALGWTGDPTSVLDRAWTSYGELRAT